MTLSTLLETLSFLDSRLKKALASAGFATVGDVLNHYPFRYEDRTAFDGWPLGSDEDRPAVCLQGVVTDVKLQRTGPARPVAVVTMQPPSSGTAADAAPLREMQSLAPAITLRWFNMPFIAKSFAADQELIVYGKVKAAKRGGLVIDHPEFEILNDSSAAEAAIHLQRIAPIYGGREGIPQKTLRRIVWLLLEHLEDDQIPDLLPTPSPSGEFGGLNRVSAIRAIHFPVFIKDKDRARRYLALEEFFLLHLQILRRRQDWDALAGTSRQPKGDLLDQWMKTLPFPLTKAQLRSIKEIRGDLSLSRPMNRLLQGDVGSGKTFVAMAAILLAVESGCQAALMAPTQILAEQHYLNFRRWLDPLGIRIGLRTSSRKEDGFDPLFSEGHHRPQILIGTHALLHGPSELPDLGLAVIDEQHKFGVEQRAGLVSQGRAPHVLVMTATPIPRTLTMTVYGDLDVSLIDEMPAGRLRVLTVVREKPDLLQVAAFLKNQFAEGRQTYLVYPLIDESETLDLKAATREHGFWEKKLAPHPVGLLHGRLKPAEKEEIMRRFRDRELAALVSTSVIEVGVDVPNASVMIIFEAERFGLAQLHQLRGRIGRGEHKSYCILATEGKSPEGMERLQTLAATSDGFAVAEADLLRRGPGDLLGSEQSGIGNLVIGDLVRDTSLVRLARRLAAEALRLNPDLHLPLHPPASGNDPAEPIRPPG